MTYSHAVVENHERNDNDNERRENDRKNGYNDDGCPVQILGDLLWHS